MTGVSREDIECIRASELFDAEWYLAQYPDVTALGMDPAEHYLTIGAFLKRDPGPKFSTAYYLNTNTDVASAALNPLLHYIAYGRSEGRSAVPFVVTPAETGERVDIVIAVFNALDDVKKCLDAVSRRRDGFDVRTIVVNDGSDAQTTEWLRKYCSSGSKGIELCEHDRNWGYTRTINDGMKKASAPYVVLLNSDTIPARGWLKSMVRCMVSAPKIGIVGPLSNAASWQSVPQAQDPHGNFIVNQIPPHISLEGMAAIVRNVSRRTYPRAPFINGFCFMVRREVIEAIGYMDEQNFPVGYGEENDYCIRAAEAGFELAVADDAYVFHAKSKSFGHENRKELTAKGSAALIQKHSKEKVASLIEKLKRVDILGYIRPALSKGIEQAQFASASADIFSAHILFLLPVNGGGGGAHSVVQEAAEMRRLGVDAKVGIKSEQFARYRAIYSDVTGLEDLFLPIDYGKLDPQISSFDIVIATIYSSVKYLKMIAEATPRILACYYIQDYEPLFFEPDAAPRAEAYDSYGAIPGAVLFAKTRWIGQRVQSAHGLMVHKVEPSIDHGVYYPARRRCDDKKIIAAMIRPQTPYRGAVRTMRLFSRLAKDYNQSVFFELFGCTEDSEFFSGLQRDFPYRNRGILTRPEVSALLRSADIFVDLSDYQAFGRTALEAMACGCAAVVPIAGGADEYAVDDVNALVVDTLNEEEAYDRLRDLIEDQNKLRSMQQAALETASRYSVTRAAVSELSLFARELARHRKEHSETDRPTICIVPDVRGDGKPAGSAYVRVLLPFQQNDILRRWRVVTCGAGVLPALDDIGIALIQRAPAGLSLEALSEWLPLWRKAGGKFIYEVDDDLLDAEGLYQRGFKGNAPEVQKKVEWLARNADLVTVSTAPLAEKLLAFNRRVTTIQNYLDSTIWRLDQARDSEVGPYSRKADVIKIGYIGTLTHFHDLAIVAEAVRNIQAEYGEGIEVEIIGAYSNVKPIFGKKVALPKDNEYPNFVDWLFKRVHWDIGIIPLADDAFNRNKSHLKFLEYAALDMAIVCSNVESYRAIASHGHNCLIVDNNTEAWYRALKELIVSEGLRKKLAGNAARLVRDRYSMQGNSAQYESVLRAVAGQGFVQAIARKEGQVG